uniref:CD48 antigen-like n=1 Tax=Sinocyclocheilus rhinocerous TaxID=307959 RepID=A0A673H9T1_9TELE
MAFGHLLMIFIAVLISNTAENAVSVQTGSSVQLDIQTDKLLPFDTLVWMNHESENIVTFSKKTVETEINNDSVVFNQSTFSLTLKSTKKTDSGLYTAKIFGSNNINVAKYRVSVIDPVDSPVLNWNVTMIAVNSCIVNVSCSGHDRTIRETYQSNNCSQKENISSEIQTLTLYCKEDIVICNYSNPVSWKNDTIQIKHLCTPYQKHCSICWNMTVWIICTTASVSFSVQFRSGHQVFPDFLVLFIALLIWFNNSQIPAEMQKNNHPSTTYSTIGQHQTTSLDTETDHTVYSIVCKSSNGRPPVN